MQNKQFVQTSMLRFADLDYAADRAVFGEFGRRINNEQFVCSAVH